MSTKRTLAALVCTIAIAALAMAFSARSVHAGKVKIAFTQQDKVVAFDPATGLGAQAGVATGDITGVTTVNFQWTPNPFPNYTYNDRVGITDTDGDQIIFRSTGTGRFLISGALSDPTLGGNPGAAPFQPFGNGLGGPQSGTYEVVATSGKYVGAYPIGQILQAKSVAYNPSAPPTAPGTLGSSYTEVTQ
jgi:hypothetical protein